MVTGYTYNDANLVTYISHAVNGEEPEYVGYQPSNYAEYTYYTDGNVRTKHESIATRFVTYTYDGADRLTCENYSMPGGVILDYLYEYDAAGNRREKTVRETDTFNDTIQSNTVTSTFDKNNRLLTATENDQTTAFTYDLNGNMLTEGGKIYSYNARNQLTSYTENGQTTTYDYWIDGLRRSKTLSNGDEEEYLWDGNNLVYVNPSLSEYLLTGFTAYYGLGIFESNQNGTKYRYQRNAHGDTTALLNQSGDIVRCYIYEDAFGTSTYSTDDTNPFRYAGQYYDRESQSYYLRARYYDPATSRMLSEDPARQGTNWYIYCNNNPIKYIDPSGLTYVIGWSYGTKDVREYEQYRLDNGYSVTVDGDTSDWDDATWSDFTQRSSFARAAYTKKQELLDMGVAESGIDVQRIDSEADLQATWNMWAGYGLIEGLDFYSHGYSEGAEVYGGSGNFWDSAQKLNFGESLRQIDGKGVILQPYAVFYGCNTANGSFAQNFSNTQAVTVYAQTDYASFSHTRTNRTWITTHATSKNVYLLSFESWGGLRNNDGLGKVFRPNN